MLEFSSLVVEAAVANQDGAMEADILTSAIICVIEKLKFEC